MNPYNYEVERPDALSRAQRALEAYPVIVFLHGAGERGGTISDRVRVHGPWKDRPFNAAVRTRLAQYFIIAPHLVDERWDAQRVLDTLCSAFDAMKRNHGDLVVNVDAVFI